MLDKLHVTAASTPALVSIAVSEAAPEWARVHACHVLRHLPPIEDTAQCDGLTHLLGSESDFVQHAVGTLLTDPAYIPVSVTSTKSSHHVNCGQALRRVLDMPSATYSCARAAAVLRDTALAHQDATWKVHVAGCNASSPFSCRGRPSWIHMFPCWPIKSQVRSHTTYMSHFNMNVRPAV